MEIKKLLLILSIILAIIIPWYMKYSADFFKKNRCIKNFCLVEMNGNLNELNICTNDEFDLLIKILSQHLPDLQFVHLLSKEEQYKIYTKLLENYVIDAYLVKEYLNEKFIDKNSIIVKDRNLYLKIMENNFNMSIFQKDIYNSIELNDEFAEKYYNENKSILFATAPFTKELPGINANAVIIDNEKINDKEYEKMLLNNKNCIPIKNFNPHSMQMNDTVLSDALLNMKIKEYKKIVLKNGQKIMLYKISEKQGEWLSYEQNSEKIKSIIKKKMAEEESIKKINELRSKFKIQISQKNLNDYIEEKNILLKNQFDFLKNLKNQDDAIVDSDLLEEELIEKQKIKIVEQEAVV